MCMYQILWLHLIVSVVILINMESILSTCKQRIMWSYKRLFYGKYTNLQDLGSFRTRKLMHLACSAWYFHQVSSNISCQSTWGKLFPLFESPPPPPPHTHIHTSLSLFLSLSLSLSSLVHTHTHLDTHSTAVVTHCKYQNTSQHMSYTAQAHAPPLLTHTHIQSE